MQVSGMRAIVTLIAVTIVIGGSVDAQTRAAAVKSTWTPPRTADGHPDFDGVWENNVATPLERPRQLADKPLLSEAELAALIMRARERFGPNADATFGDAFYNQLVADLGPVGLGATGTYSQNWLPDRYFERRTSLIVDPADGRLPSLTPEGVNRQQALAARAGRLPESASDFNLPNRCIMFGIPDLFAAYMSVYRIIQTPDTIAIVMEKVHDTRIIPLDTHPHLSPSIRQYIGDGRGRWDGDTLVVETTNFHPNGNPMGGLFNRASPNMKLTERFRRVSEDTIEYTFTVDDPTVWTKPWTAMIPWKQSKADVLEYACHEGNYSLRGMLSAARVQEAGTR